MFFTIPPSEAVQLAAPDYLKAITLRISNIAPGGAIYVYSTPFKGMPARFDAEHPEQRIETESRTIWTQKMDGAETFSLELLGFERDPEAELLSSEPQPIRWR